MHFAISLTLFLVYVVKQEELCLVTGPLSKHPNSKPNATRPTSTLFLQHNQQ